MTKETCLPFVAAMAWRVGYGGRAQDHAPDRAYHAAGAIDSS